MRITEADYYRITGQKPPETPKIAKPSKYKSKQVKKADSLDGRHYHSKGEYQRSLELQREQEQGLLSDLSFQPKFSLDVCGTSIGSYSADFRYRRPGDSLDTIEDFKGNVDDVFIMKWRHVNAQHKGEFNFILTNKKGIIHGEPTPTRYFRRSKK